MLTTKQVENAKARDGRRTLYADKGGVPGLNLIVQPSGKKSWGVWVRIKGEQKRITLNPDGALLPLSEARERARAIRDAALLGRDLAEEDKQARSALYAPGCLFADVVRDFDREYIQANKLRTAVNYKRWFDRPLDAWGERPIATITRKDILALLKEVRVKNNKTRKGGPYASNYLHGALRKLFDWAVNEERLKQSPFYGWKANLAREESRDRVLTNEEIVLLWSATGKQATFGAAIRMLLLTGQRRDEVFRMTRSELSECLWVIPKERSKNGLPHSVPLSSLARDILARVPRIAGRAGWVFTVTGDRPISSYSRGKRHLTRLMEEESGHAIPDWRFHDLRRTMVTLMGEKLGILPHVVEAVVNHQSGTKKGVAGVYNRATYEGEKGVALEKWAQWVRDLVGADAGSIIPLRRRRA